MRNTKNSTARKLWNLLNSQEKPVKFTIQVDHVSVLPRRTHG